MPKLLGTSDQAPVSRAASLSGQPPVARGPAGAPGPPARVELGLTMRQKIHRIRAAMANIHRQLDSLDELNAEIPAGQWISLDRATSFEDWIAKCRARSANPLSLRDALEQDLRVLRDELRQLELEARRARGVASLKAVPLIAPPPPPGAGPGAGQPSPPAAGTPPKDLPPGTADDFPGDLSRLLDDAHRDGHLDGAQIKRLQKEGEMVLERWRQALGKEPSPENMRGTLKDVADMMKIGLFGGGGNGPVESALAEVGGAAVKWSQEAANRFRQQPTLENFKDKYFRIAETQKLGAPAPLGMPAGVKRLRTEKSYLVKAGDTLRSISRMFYGEEGVWDQIYWANLDKFLHTSNPGALLPGIILVIP